MSACRRWNEKEAAYKTWTNFKVHFAAAHRQNNQMQGESSANSGYHAANEAMGQAENEMDEATIGSLTNLATSTATDRRVVPTLTEANARLVQRSKRCKSIAQKGSGLK
jgi:hypothetical protein